MAAGLSLEAGNLEGFTAALFEAARAQLGGDVPPAPILDLEAEVPLSNLTWGFVKDIRALEPCGHHNPKPLFLTGPVSIENVRRMGADQKHLSFRVRSGATSMRAVGWSMGERFDELQLAGRASLAFAAVENHYNGNTTVELDVRDFQVGETAKLN